MQLLRGPILHQPGCSRVDIRGVGRRWLLGVFASLEADAAPALLCKPQRHILLRCVLAVAVPLCRQDAD
jgi:hypothetical protein